MINLTRGKNWTTSYLPFTDTNSVTVQKLKSPKVILVTLCKCDFGVTLFH